MKQYILPCAIYLFTLSAISFSEIPVGYKSYAAWEKLPQLRIGVKSGLASSYDRTGGNDDWNYYEWPTGQINTETVCTVKTIQGPGVIYRFWMPHLTGRQGYVVRMYFDGEPIPRIDTMSDTVFDGLFSYFDAPLVSLCAGGQTCYEPIAFAESVVIKTVNRFSNRHYYQYSYLTYPQGSDINSYTGTLSPQDQNDRDTVAAMFENAGRYPCGNSPTAIEVNVPATNISSNFVIANINGPGVVRKLYIKMSGANDAELLGLNLQVFYDGGTTPAIDVPVGHFFGAGESRALYKSLPLGTDSNDGFYCYWPMPFKQSITIKLHNTTATAISIDGAKVEYKSEQLDHHTCYLKAIEKSTIQAGQTYHNILSTTGCGHFVGNLLYLAQDCNSFWMLEGDDVIYCDGELVQFGTGLEDTYNGGYYYNWVAVQDGEPEGFCPHSAIRPLSGILYVNKAATSRAYQYRWRIADCIPFTKSIEVNAESGYSNNGARWQSVGFWYELPVLLQDLNEDGIVDFADFTRFAAHWQESNCGNCDFADFTGDGKVSSDDLRQIGENWLKER